METADILFYISTSALMILMLSIIIVNIRTYRDNNKNPHLSYTFLANFAYGKSSEKPFVIAIKEDLEVRLSFDYVLSVKIYAKNKENEWVKVEAINYQLRSPRNRIKIQGPWEKDISIHFKKMYEQKREKEQLLVEKKMKEIDCIKNNWKFKL